MQNGEISKTAEIVKSWDQKPAKENAVVSLFSTIDGVYFYINYINIRKTP